GFNGGRLAKTSRHLDQGCRAVALLLGDRVNVRRGIPQEVIDAFCLVKIAAAGIDAASDMRCRPVTRENRFDRGRENAGAPAVELTDRTIEAKFEGVAAPI